MPLSRRKARQSPSSLDDYQQGEHHDILLPTSMSIEFDRITDEQAAAARTLRIEEEEKRSAQQPPTSEESAKPGALGKAAAVGSDDPHVPGWVREIHAEITGGMPSTLLHQLYSPENLAYAVRVTKRRGGKDEQESKFTTGVLQRLGEIGTLRRLSMGPVMWEAELDQLEQAMPNFTQVIQYIRCELALAHAAGQAPEFAPLLLNGPPGVGKTEFARRLAKFFRCGFLSVSLETAQTAAALSGSEEYWSNSKPGALFNLLTESEFANPVVLLDELDKAQKDRYDPLSALYGLLESGSARQWHDLALPALQLDASKVTWILTSNQLHFIPAPLHSRMRVFEIPALTTEQARVIATRIFAELVSKSQVEFDDQLPFTMASVLAQLSPREMHHVARELLGTAVLNKRKHVKHSDLDHIDLDPGTRHAWAWTAVFLEQFDVEPMENRVLH